MKNSAKHIIFYGRVQGVGFRFTSSRIANRYQLTGFVRNLPNRSVEILLQGPEEDIKNCIRDIKKSFNGYITNTEMQQTEQNPQYTSFNITF